MYGSTPFARRPGSATIGRVKLAFELQHVTKRYTGQPALDGVALAIEPGQTTVLIGPSGCGKSTILRLLAGLVWPSDGTVQFDDAPLTRARLPELRRKIGYVIQEGGLFPHLTGRGNVELLPRHVGWAQGRIAERVAELAALVHLQPALLGRYPGELSGGQRQRVSLMRALMLDPAALLLDEPLGALDPMIRFDLQNDLSEIFATLNKTVVMVTHDLAEASFFADVAVLLKAGQIVQRGAPADLFDRPADAFVTQFVTAQRQMHQSVRTRSTHPASVETDLGPTANADADESVNPGPSAFRQI